MQIVNVLAYRPQLFKTAFLCVCMHLFSSLTFSFQISFAWFGNWYSSHIYLLHPFSLQVYFRHLPQLSPCCIFCLRSCAFITWVILSLLISNHPLVMHLATPNLTSFLQIISNCCYLLESVNPRPHFQRRGS